MIMNNLLLLYHVMNISKQLGLMREDATPALQFWPHWLPDATLNINGHGELGDC